MIRLRPAADRGAADFGWLDTRHTFSFGHYYDPAWMGYSDLRVINDDRIAPGAGFDTHGHRDMEIFTYVLDGAVAHKDSMGNGSVIPAGDVQVMRAGRGVRHSEFNASKTDPLHLLQIWIEPETKGVEPAYAQVAIPPEEKDGRLRLILSRDGAEGSLVLQQDVRVHAGCFDGAQTATLPLDPARKIYVHVARGRLDMNGVPLVAGDGAMLEGEAALTFSAGQQAEVLVFDLRPA